MSRICVCVGGGSLYVYENDIGVIDVSTFSDQKKRVSSIVLTFTARYISSTTESPPSPYTSPPVCVSRCRIFFLGVVRRCLC